MDVPSTSPHNYAAIGNPITSPTDATPYSGGNGWDYFPMFCPMRACNTTYIAYQRPEDQPKYVESTGMNGFVQVMYILYQFSIREQVVMDDSFFYIFRALAVLAEAIRILVCSMRYEFCAAQSPVDAFNRSDPFAGFAAVDYHTRLRNEACSIAMNSFLILHKHLDGVVEPLASGRVNFCEELFLKGELTEMLLKVPSVILDTVVKKVTRGETPEEDAGISKPLGNNGTRFDFESFFNDTRHYRDVPYDARIFAHIRYPTVWSPNKICKPLLFEPVLPGYETKPLVNWQTIVRLFEHRWVLNFGAADGACGVIGDWNHDPANCLLQNNRSGMVIEGDKDRIPDLNATFLNHTSLTRFFRPLAIENVIAEIRQHVETVEKPRLRKTFEEIVAKNGRRDVGKGAPARQQTASSEKIFALTEDKALADLAYAPALLKMDIDNADCYYLQTALQIVKPLVIFFEIWADIPPPFDYRELPRKPYAPAPHHAPGCSLQAFVNIGKEFGYSLTEVLLEDAVLVRNDLLFGKFADLDAEETVSEGVSARLEEFVVPFLSGAVEADLLSTENLLHEGRGSGVLDHSGSSSSSSSSSSPPAGTSSLQQEDVVYDTSEFLVTSLEQHRRKPVPYGVSFYDPATGSGRVYGHQHLYCQFGKTTQEKMIGEGKTTSTTFGERSTSASDINRPAYLRSNLTECYHDLAVHALYADGFFCHPQSRWLVRPDKIYQVDWSLLMDQNSPLPLRENLIHDVMRARRWHAGLRGAALENRDSYYLEYPK
ncbi:unnamed protein product [Amoebophrya sp. A120]|nr:unnamed protein product [Amoebophrya sp. A120]|eukprot:GSA120T00008352001.1